ncbi:MAG: polysaccharide deacetylase family protein [Candidatus Pacebacteria bacterium]|nr:polysaccharide deacetylase family protein [Candidatus Paceibacterota bacterium]
MLKDLISLKKYLLSLAIRSRKAGVLMYHSVSNDKRFFTVASVNFEKQLRFLKKKKFNVIKIGDLVKTIQDKKQMLHKTAVLSFDDGYQDNYSVVFPLLKRYNFPVTIFLITDLIGQEGYLNWDEIKEMQQSGFVNFGCHTLSHPKLNQISKERLRAELTESKQIIEKQLGQKCDVFAYPSGCFDNSVVAMVKNAGYQGAFTVREGAIGLKNNIFLLPRLSIDSSTTFSQFLGKISGLQFIKGRI